MALYLYNISDAFLGHFYDETLLSYIVMPSHFCELFYHTYYSLRPKISDVYLYPRRVTYFGTGVQHSFSFSVNVVNRKQ